MKLLPPAFLNDFLDRRTGRAEQVECEIGAVVGEAQKYGDRESDAACDDKHATQ